MLSFNYNVVHVTLFYVFRVAHSVIELPAIEDNDIAITESVIRNTVNDLFGTLKVRGSKNRPKFKKYSVLHNFFVSITLKDCDTLKKIVQLSQVNNIDNNTLHFIAQINEVFDETDNKSNEATDDIYVNMHIEKFIKKLRDLKQIYQFNKYFSKHDINEKIIEHLSRDGTTLANVTNETNKINDSTDPIDNNGDEVWTPVLQSGRRIFHGHRTHITHYPFMASVQLFDRFHCAGSIIRTDLVITAASCLQLAYNNRFFRENPAFLSVQIGSDYYEEGGENIPVLEVYFHYEYDPRTLNNNIALMRLTTHIIFSKQNKKVKRIDFDENDSPLAVDTNGIMIVGWGAKDSTGNLFSPWENRLTYAQLDYYPMDECQQIYTKDYVTSKHFCAGFFTKPTGACQHDVGGPGIYRGYLVGVISFGPPICGTPDAPTVFTKVGFYKDWINKIIDTPAPYYKPLTTLLVTHNTFKPVYTTKTTKPYKMQPIINSVLRRESLRILEDDKLFKDFVSTMFKQKGINKVQQADENTEQKELLRQKHTTETPETYFNTGITEPDKATTNMLSHGYVLDVVANKFLDFMGMNSKPTTTENNVNVDESNTKLGINEKEDSKNSDVYSYEENSEDLITKHSKLTKAKPKSSSASTYPLFVGIEYNDDDSAMSQPQFKANNKHFGFKDVKSSILEIDNDRKVKNSKQKFLKAKISKKIKDKSSPILTRKPESSEYEDVTNDKLVKSYNNIDNISKLDSLHKHILDRVKEKRKRSSKFKKHMTVKKTRKRHRTATTPLLKESIHKNKYKRLVPKMKTRTTATAETILSPIKFEYEDENYEKNESEMEGTVKFTNSNTKADSDDFMIGTGETNLAGNKNNKKSSQNKHGTKVKSRIVTFTREFIDVTYKDASTARSAINKIHKNVIEDVNTNFQLDSLVKDIFDYIELGSPEHIGSKKVVSVKKVRNRVPTATIPMLKKENNYEKKTKRSKNKYGSANEDNTGDLVLESDISKLEGRTKSSSDEVEYEDDDSKINEPEMEVTKIPRKSQHKYTDDRNNNEAATTETVPKNLDSSNEKSLKTTAKHSRKRKSKYSTDVTVLTDKPEYEDEDGQSDINTSEVSEHSMNRNSNSNDDTNKDMNNKENGSNDSKLEKDITELLDELDLRKILESTENTVQIKGSKMKNIKGQTGKTPSQSNGGDSSEASRDSQID